MSEKLEGNILVTGTNRGIGLELVKQLAEKTGEVAHIYACCREPAGTSAEVRQLQIKSYGFSVCNGPTTHEEDFLMT